MDDNSSLGLSEHPTTDSRGFEMPAPKRHKSNSHLDTHLGSVNTKFDSGHHDAPEASRANLSGPEPTTSAGDVSLTPARIALENSNLFKSQLLRMLQGGPVSTPPRHSNTTNPNYFDARLPDTEYEVCKDPRVSMAHLEASLKAIASQTEGQELGLLSYHIKQQLAAGVPLKQCKDMLENVGETWHSQMPVLKTDPDHYVIDRPKVRKDPKKLMSESVRHAIKAEIQGSAVDRTQTQDDRHE